MALHPRLSRPSLELPPRRASHGVLIGVVLAVMGAGFALAMPIAMKTWTEAAQRTQAVEQVNAAEPPTDEFSDPFEVPEPVLVPATGPLKREPDRSQTEPGPVSSAHEGPTPQHRVERDVEDRPTPGRSNPEPVKGESDGDDPPAEPEPQEGKRDDEDEERESLPDQDEDDESQDRSAASGRATGREDEEPLDEPEDDEDDEDASHSGTERGSGSKGDTQGTKH